MLLVLALLGLCFVAGGVSLVHGIGAVQARGAAQAWQAAGTVAQVGSIWQGSEHEVSFAGGRLAVTSGAVVMPVDLGEDAPDVNVFANIVRWRTGDGVVVRFLSASGHPDSAGSLYFRAPGGDYRVTVRLESGLSVRTRVESAP